ncbi:IS3 family transposase [Paenibacillus radicibacter]|uniref:IS3 family transposase n=1 Tax=Paenibacillus radicibacter TaxID=2972488 RepID=UPI00358DF750
MEQLQLELEYYFNWFNHHHVHGTLGYLSPIEFKKQPLKKRGQPVILIWLPSLSLITNLFCENNPSEPNLTVINKYRVHVNR